MKRLLLISSLLVMMFSMMGCDNSNGSKSEIVDIDITTSLHADERFYANVYINANKDGAIITMKNGFGQNLRAVDIKATQYNTDGKKVKNTENIMAEYLLDGQEYVNLIPIRLDDRISRVEISISINEALKYEDIGTLYNNFIAKQCSINRTFNSVSYDITNRSPDIVMKDTEFILVYYKDTVPVYCIMLDIHQMNSNSSCSGYDHIPPVVSAKDGIQDLDFNKVKVIVNRAR